MHLHVFAASLTALVLGASAALADIERTITREFPASPGGRLEVDTFSGPIEVRTHAAAQVLVKLEQKIDARDDAAADRVLADLKLAMEADAAGVKLKAEWPKGSNGWFRRAPVRLAWTVTVPENYHVDLDTAGGAIRVGDLTGNVKADTSGGGITIGSIRGDVHADTSGGGIKVAGATGRLLADTSGGSIDVGRSDGPAELDTSGGSIRVEEARGTVQADTSGGSIRVRFVGAIAGPSSLDTSGGGITAVFDRTAAFDLAASASGGGVKCDLPVTTSRTDRGSLDGQVNGGGPRVRLNTSGGGVRVEAAN